MTAESSEDRATVYLSRALELNPVGFADEIVQLRRRFISGEAVTVSAASLRPTDTIDEVEVREQKRAEATQAIEKIRASFWKTPLEPLLATLQRINCDEFPELKDSVQRLQVVARERHLFAGLTEQKHFDSNFFTGFRKLIVAPSAKASRVREKLYSSIHSSIRHKRYKRMIKLLRKQIPATCALESSFLESIEKRKLSFDLPSEPKAAEPDSWGCGSWGTGIALYFIVRMIIRLMAG